MRLATDEQHIERRIIDAIHDSEGNTDRLAFRAFLEGLRMATIELQKSRPATVLSPDGRWIDACILRLDVLATMVAERLRPDEEKESEAQKSA